MTLRAGSLPIFDAGRLRANLVGKNADYDIAVEQYNQTLADAIRDVVDQLASFRSVDEQRRQQVQAQSTAQEAYDLALLCYRESIGNYLQVLSAEAPLLAQQGLDRLSRIRRGGGGGARDQPGRSLPLELPVARSR